MIVRLDYNIHSHLKKTVKKTENNHLRGRILLGKLKRRKVGEWVGAREGKKILKKSLLSHLSDW